ncbi:hypothetical protein HYH03_018575 [Edaphochlamys debaryana]|uniref:Uncharacterized protein n=1 Tax=Edaphochlamys debaryana TaxID=47281 RepID=A0A836BMZ8_9CHLO|nr:hypothetical protein HYH03_018575 [Edaphochlamys debaryana]|eukprot:KAG2482500.1 hypothetical protein HYH03_018575 [Edaphochlamys debaryana]
MPGTGAAARLQGVGTGQAIANNSATAPEPVVRQRVIPGWEGPKKVAKGGQTAREIAAQLKAEALAEAAKAGKAPPGANAGGKNTPQGGLNRSLAGSSNRLAESDADTRRDVDSSDDASSPVQPRRPADFTDGGSTSGARTPEAEASFPRQDSEGDLYAGAAEDADPIVATDPVYADGEGNVVVQDIEGNFVPMESVYGPEPELMGFQDEAGNITYHVVIRQSLYDRQLAMLAAEAPEAPPAEPSPVVIPTPAPAPKPAPPVFIPAPEPVAVVPEPVVYAAPEVVPAAGQDASELGDLLALMGVAPSGQPYMPVQTAAVEYGGAGAAYGGYGQAAAPVGCGVDEAGDDVDDLMQLLCV